MTSTSAASSPFLDAMLGNTVTIGQTENGAVSLATSQPVGMRRQIGARVDLFFKAVRGLKPEQLHQYLDAAWQEDALDTLKIIFQTRDCRGGKGERLLFRQMLAWVGKHHPEALVPNLSAVAELGRWDDLLFVPGGVEALAAQLQRDYQVLIDHTVPTTEKKISLAAKWAPTENHALDKDFQVVGKMIRALDLPHGFTEANASGRIMYRKQYLGPLRSHLRIVERAMCQNEWKGIDYSHVPSRAMKMYKGAFKTHDEKRFNEWSAALSREDKKTDDGKVVKVNAKQLFPHELVAEYTGYGGKPLDPVIEEQWKVLEAETRKLGHLSRSLCVCDVSGSMAGEPMTVCVALGLLISGVTAPPFQDQVLTFHSVPQFFHTQGASLQERVQKLERAPWGGSTNLQATFDLILRRAKQFQVKPEDMPERLFIFSDMQFNSAVDGFTNFETMNAKYRAAGYTRPDVIFWNLRASSSTKEVPVQANEQGVALLSGFSPTLLKSVLGGQDLSPWGVLRSILDDRRYASIQLPTVRLPSTERPSPAAIDVAQYEAKLQRNRDKQALVRPRNKKRKSTR